MNDTTVAREKLAADFRSVMDDIDALLSATTTEAKGDVTAMRTRMRDQLETMRERVSQVQHDTVARVKKAAGATDNYVHSHPWQSIGTAAAVGLAIGFLLGRR